MKLSTRQDIALKKVHDWLTSGDTQVLRLFGYAGTGKTTLARHFAEGVSGQVLFGAYTGKAAHVLREKGCPGATTIHRLIYEPSSKSAGRLQEMEQELLRLRKEELPGPDELHRMVWLEAEIEHEKDSLKQPHFVLRPDSEVHHSKLVIIDECSMVDMSMGEDLLSYGTKVLVLGDPAQLPPVKGAGFFTEQDPDIMLDEIHRQAQGNPIIDLATKVRNGEALENGTYGDSRVMDKSDPDYCPELVMAQDQAIVGKNITRHAFNRRFREELKRTGDIPVLGDKLICLRNNHDLGLMNGQQWEVTDAPEGVSDDDRFLTMGLTNDDGLEIGVEAHTGHFRGEEIEFFDRMDAEEFTYGYAITCHKAQGSQWGKVFVLDQSSVFGYNRRRWLYTAITRAAQSVLIAK